MVPDPITLRRRPHGHYLATKQTDPGRSWSKRTKRDPHRKITGRLLAKDRCSKTWISVIKAENSITRQPHGNMNATDISTEVMLTTENYADMSPISTDTGNTTSGLETIPGTLSDSNAVLGAVCCVITVIAILANLLMVVVFSKMPILRSPGPAYLLLSITAVNLIAAVLVLIPNTLTLFNGSWSLGQYACKLAAFISCLAFHLTFHTVGVAFFERYLKICRPIKHAEIFTPFVTLILVCGLWFFAAVLALFPLVGWSEYAYLPTQKQCWISAAGWRSHLNHMVFTLVLALVLPVFTSLICLTVLLRYAYKTRRVGTLDGAGENEKTSTIQETYCRKLKKKERQLQTDIRDRNSHIKKTKRKENTLKMEQLPNVASSTVSSSSSSSDEDDRANKNTEAKKRQKTQRYDAALVRSLTWILLLLVVTWLPHLIAKCLETLEPLNNTSTSGELLLATSFLTYATHALIPTILLLDYKTYRKALWSICARKKLENKHTISLDSGTKLTRARTGQNSIFDPSTSRRLSE